MVAALILIADGTEEMEFTISYDTLVRGEVECTSAFVGPTDDAPTSVVATCSRGVKIVADVAFDPAACAQNDFDLLVIPGGLKGAETLSKNSSVQLLIREYLNSDKYVGMICAGTLAALTSGLPKQPITSHPSVKSQLDKDFEYKEESVVVSGHLITSRGPGTAFPFALTLVELLCGSEKRKAVSGPMVFPEGVHW
ncbi:DJ-1 [Thelephora terrestris]|uniref:D-lactate dehydratase n=1 Tax=Thelephora terrestris TaxID=56493 RepID=A0A9P6LA59_9AGAM|nr:DJ-1 [Thelephora terrestris]